MPEPEPEPARLPFDLGCMTERQSNALLHILDGRGGMATIASYYELVGSKVDALREISLTQGHIIRQVMAQTRFGYPGIAAADLLPVTRGMLTAIFRELDDAGD
jgi:hypothetical protein